ncbi:hypothetical protein [Streptomyces sp. NPDC014777]|uniref:hypothetical protein n=1 Tax=Streptomyces sp. NPDC014777 TaxID=3364910 RepID=UPI0036FC6A43
MERRQRLLSVVTVTALVFAWSAVMTWLGQVYAIAALAPVLGLTVVQIVRAVRAHTPAPRPRVPAVFQEEDDAAR